MYGLYSNTGYPRNIWARYEAPGLESLAVIDINNKNIDLDYLVLETDSPYLTPEPFRGTKNEPHNIIYVAEEIAKLKNVSIEEVLKKTTENAISQFDLPI